ncbi:MAG: hypothetical protein J6A67_08570 [Clostridia bacterium]|nr:hypothetical protein [Clostridia bacterium]
MKKFSDISLKKSKGNATKKSWDTASKIVFVAVALVIVALIVFFVARGKKDALVDDVGQTHIVVTDIHGDFVQDEYGNLYEKVKDENGVDTTKSYIFPDKVVSSNGKKIENAFIKLKLNKGWSDYCANDYLGMQHIGVCKDTGKPQCEVKIRYDIMADPNNLYAKEKGLARAYVEKIDGFDNLKEYETEVLGLKAKAMSYTSNHGEGTFYYYLVEQGLALFEIRAFAYNECFTEAELIEEIGKAYELKNLGGTRPEIPSTEAPSEEELLEEEIVEEDTTSATSAK